MTETEYQAEHAMLMALITENADEDFMPIAMMFMDKCDKNRLINQADAYERAMKVVGGAQ